MRRIILPTLFLLSLSGFAQVEVNKSQLQFGDVTTGSFKKLSLTVENMESTAVDVDYSIIFPGFWVTPTSQTIQAGKKAYVDVVFEPEQNIKYNAELILVTNSRLGDVRVDLLGSGRYPESYYSSTFDLYEEDLKDELKSVVSANYTSLGYTGARDRMYATIDNVGGTVTCVYTGRTAEFTTRSGANAASFNCEHTWPQSFFGSREPEKSDIHHLFPTYSYANTQRSNLPFGYVTSASWTEGGSKRGSDVFEVRPEHRGNTARAMFYFALRYGNVANFLTQQEDILRDWSENDAPDNAERARNDAIQTLQKNRNPFVDHPEFLDRIHSLSGISEEPDLPKLELSRAFVNLEDQTPWHDRDEYKLYVVNNGNRTFTLEKRGTVNDQIGTGLLPPPNLLKPGESMQIMLTPYNFNATTQIQDTVKLEFVSQNTESPERIQFSIPVNMDLIAVLGADDHRTNSSLYVRNNKLVIHKALKAELHIYDLQGRSVYFSELTGRLTEISLSFLNKGHYFAVLNDEADSLVKRFIVH